MLSYSEDFKVMNLILIPKFFFVPSIIEKRNALSSSAKRANWVGCNILISEIPIQGKIDIIKNQDVVDISNVVQSYSNIKKLQTNNIESRGWLFDVFNCVNQIPTAEFTLQDIYKYTELLQKKHINNHNIEAKIRQQLQFLRDKGFVEFLGGGRYRKKI